MPALVLQFPTPASPELVHRVLNFVEDVCRLVTAQDLGSVSQINHYSIGRFVVTVSKKDKLGETQLQIQKLLRRHLLVSECVVSRIQGMEAEYVHSQQSVKLFAEPE